MPSASSEIESGLSTLTDRFQARFAAAQNEQELRAIRAEALGKKGELTALLRGMGRVPPEQRKQLGEKVNSVKDSVEAAFDARLDALNRAARQAELVGRPFDLTLPGRLPLLRGHLHPITRVKAEILEIFQSLGFQVAWGPEVEFEANNFTKLAFPRITRRPTCRTASGSRSRGFRRTGASYCALTPATSRCAR